MDDVVDKLERLLHCLVNVAAGHQPPEDGKEMARRLLGEDSPLAGRAPGPKEAPRLQRAASAVGRLKHAGRPSPALRAELAEILAGDGPWAALRSLAESAFGAGGSSGRHPSLPPSPSAAHAEALQRLLPRLILSGKRRRLYEGHAAIARVMENEGVPIGQLGSWVPDGGQTRILTDLSGVVSTASGQPQRRRALFEQAADLLRRLPEEERAALMELVQWSRAFVQEIPQGRRGGGRGRGGSPGGGRGRGGRGGRAGGQPGALQIRTVAVPVVSDWGANAQEVTIYLDEGQHNATPDYQDRRMIGMVAGVVWLGSKPDPQALPIIQLNSAGHIRGEQTMRGHLARLLECGRALPVVLPVYGELTAKQKWYETAVDAALQLILGWMLPPSRQPRQLTVHLERYGGYDPGDKATELLAGKLAGWSQQNPARFAHWNVVEMAWKGKTHGYIPYGDILAYAFTAGGAKLLSWLKPKELPGFLPLSLDLVPRLMRLEQLEQVGNVGDALDLADTLAGTQLWRVVQEDLVRRFAARGDLQERLLAELDTRLRSADGDLGALRRQLACGRALVPGVPEDAPLARRLVHLAVDLQAGEPAADDAAAELARRYDLLRVKAYDNDPSLATHLDLSLAERSAERGDAAEALALAEDLANAERFRFLPLALRSRILALRARARALGGDAAGADPDWAAAQALLEQAELPMAAKTAETERLCCLRAANALEGDLPAADPLLAAALGEPAEAVARLHGSTAQRRQHLLLLRALWRRDGLAAARAAYLTGRAAWVGDDRHPWSLIWLLRGLLLWEEEVEDGSDEDCLDRALALACADPAGDHPPLAASTIATVAWCCIEDEREDGSYRQQAERLLAALEPRLPAAAAAIATLRSILETPDPERIDEALALLPFTWR